MRCARRVSSRASTRAADIAVLVSPALHATTAIITSERCSTCVLQIPHLVRRLEHVPDVARDRARLTRGAGDVLERAGHARGAEAHEIELEILEGEAGTLELRQQRRPP